MGVIRVAATYTDDQGNEHTVLSSPTSTVVRRQTTGTIAISGDAQEGGTLSIDTSALTVNTGEAVAIISYAWKKDGTPINGATSNTYTVASDQSDVGAVFDVTITTETDDSFTSPQVTIANVNDPASGLLTIDGTEEEGQTLTANTGSIVEEDGLGVFAYAWKRDGVTVGTSSSYPLTQSDVGKIITLEVSFTDAQNTVETLTAQTAAIVNVEDGPTGAVIITGFASAAMPEEGETLTADTSTVADADGLGASFSYQWKRDGAPIDGATSSTYTLVEDDASAAITVTVSYTDGQGSAESLTSAATNPVNSPSQGSVTIAGTAAPSETLTSTVSITDANGIASTLYQWQAKATAEEAYSTTVATTENFTIPASATYQYVRLRVTVTDTLGNETSFNSVNEKQINYPVVAIGSLAHTLYQSSTTKTISITVRDYDGLSSNSAMLLENGTHGNVTNLSLTGEDAFQKTLSMTYTLTSNGYVGPDAFTVQITDSEGTGGVTHQIAFNMTMSQDEAVGSGDPFFAPFF